MKTSEVISRLELLMVKYGDQDVEKVNHIFSYKDSISEFFVII